MDREHTAQASSPSMEELRKLILGLTPQELQKLHNWLRDKDSFSEEIAGILPSSVIKTIELSQPLGDALMPIIEQAIFASVQNNPKALADALFPIMGPAIRKSIADTFRSLIESLNRTLEKQFSPERIKWRLQAMFSSKSYAEIVLLKGLSFEVKHVFLIHGETGLLISDFSTGEENLDSADMISSMLKAVQDFVKDSFGGVADPDSHLDTIKLHELNVWIEEGPFATLAVVFEGNAPESKRVVFKETLEKIHKKFGTLLKDFNGDTSAFSMVTPYLKACAIEQKPPKTSYKKPLIILIILLVLLGVWSSFAFIKKRRFENFIEKLSDKPSVIILDYGDKSGVFYVKGMKDPLCQGFNAVAADCKLDTLHIRYSWINYLSLDSAFVVKRARNYLPPVKGVRFVFKDNTLFPEGEASPEWIDSAKTYARLNNAAFKTDFTNLKIDTKSILRKAKEKISEMVIAYKKGKYAVDEANAEIIDSILSYCDDIEKAGLDYTLSLSAVPDSQGDKTVNRTFAKYRLNAAVKYIADKNSDIKISTNIDTVSKEGYRLMKFKIKEK